MSARKSAGSAQLPSWKFILRRHTIREGGVPIVRSGRRRRIGLVVILLHMLGRCKNRLFWWRRGWRWWREF